MEERKTEVITFRVTPEMREWLEEAALSKGWTISHYCDWFFSRVVDWKMFVSKLDCSSVKVEISGFDMAY